MNKILPITTSCILAFSNIMICPLLFLPKEEPIIETEKVAVVYEHEEVSVKQKTILSDDDIFETLDIQVTTEEDMFEHVEDRYTQIMSDLETCEDKMEWYIGYKDFISSYPNIDPPETIYDVFTDEEVTYMLRCIETEVHGGDFESKVNVANVILNRIESETFPNDPISVITATDQFAYHKKKIAEDTILALEYAYQIEDTTNGSLYFHSNSKTNTFNGATYVFTDDVGHHFYNTNEIN